MAIQSAMHSTTHYNWSEKHRESQQMQNYTYNVFTNLYVC